MNSIEDEPPLDAAAAPCYARFAFSTLSRRRLVMKTSLLVVALTAGLVAADDAADAVKKDIQKLQGTWVPTSIQFSGQDLTNDDHGQFKLVFKGDQATVEGNSNVKKEYGKLTMKLDPSTLPRCLDIVVTGGDQKDAVLEGIYELKDDTLKNLRQGDRQGASGAVCLAGRLQHRAGRLQAREVVHGATGRFAPAGPRDRPPAGSTRWRSLHRWWRPWLPAACG